MSVGHSAKRVDAYDKVTGAAKYTADLMPQGTLVTKIVHSTIANGVVKGFDLTEAEKVKGVVKIFTCFDVPQIEFATPGHPWTLDPSHQDVPDRLMLAQRVRVYGDDIAAVVAEDEVAASRAARLVKVEYEEYPPILDVDEAVQDGVKPLHPNQRPTNLLGHSAFRVGGCTFGEACAEEGLVAVDKRYQTQRVQHCHLETAVSYAYMEGDRVVVVTSTQIPHIVRRVVGQALGIPWARVRIIKPYIGGGFGNKQDVLYEPLNAFLCMRLGGRPVRIETTREETLACTRTRHAIRFDLSARARKDGTLVARKCVAVSDQGGYASHGHGIVANSINVFKQLYHDEKALECDASTVYTNKASGGAMRGYGIPQIIFASECLMDDLARKLDMDPLELRVKNCMPENYEDPHTHIRAYTNGLRDCMQKGRELFDWDQKRVEYAHQTGDKRRGVGMAIFDYKTGVFPISLETAGCRMTLNQDGSIMMMTGATEIGQGADTVFVQMAAETVGLSEQNVHLYSTQDTDLSPFDTGAYASRQTYVTGMAVKKTAETLKAKILDYASFMLTRPAEELDIAEDAIVDRKTREALLPMSELAVTAQYSRERAEHISAECSIDCKDNTFATGVCFAEVEVDLPMGQVKVLNLLNVHDSGKIVNPQLAAAQVHGGMSMGLGYGLYEELLYDKKGRPLNDNLLDYKMPTSMDSPPHLRAEFVELDDPTGPYGNKALGEPPAIPVAPALRNAILHATGVAFDTLPISQQRMIERFAAEGLIKEAKPDV